MLLSAAPPASPPTRPAPPASAHPCSPLWGGGADAAARRLFTGLARQEAREEEEEEEEEVDSEEVDSEEGTTRLRGGPGGRGGIDWIELDAAAERAHLADPLRGYVAQFDAGREEAGFAEVNGAWLGGRLRSIAARAKLAESRMIRRLTKRLSA
jgi:hypothetical protein